MKSAPSTLILRIPSSLHRRLKQEARWAGTSLNRHCLGLLGGKAVESPARGPVLAPSPPHGTSLRTRVLHELADLALETVGEEVDGLVLFGSLARGQETASSDVDLLIVLGRSVALDRDVYSRWQFDRFAGREIAPLFVHLPAAGERVGGLWFEVALDGAVLFDRDLRVTRFLSRVRNLVAAGGVRRMITHGHPYWVSSDDVTLGFPSGREL
jgi:predicted nucleotidyltransferase